MQLKKKNAFLMGDFNANTLNELKNSSTHIHDFSKYIFYLLLS